MSMEWEEKIIKAKAEWQAHHDGLEGVIEQGAVADWHAFTNLLAQERELHRSYVEAVRAWADVKRGPRPPRSAERPPEGETSRY